MSPNYKTGDYVLLLKDSSSLSSADVIVFNSNDQSNEKYIKRVIGAPGQGITYLNNQLYRSGIKVKEPYLANNTQTSNYIWMKNGTTIIPQNQYFVLGDNRQLSKDSRNFGLVKNKQIIGKVIAKYWQK